MDSIHSSAVVASYISPEVVDVIATYFENFENLCETEQWDEIISQGTPALEAAEKMDRQADEAKICAELSTAYFNKGDYETAFRYVKQCQDLSNNFKDPSLFIHSFHLEARIKLRKNDFGRAICIAKTGLDLAQKFEAKDDESLFRTLLQEIDAEIKKFH